MNKDQPRKYNDRSELFLFYNIKNPVTLTVPSL